jgi:hypothetical protein
MSNYFKQPLPKECGALVYVDNTAFIDSSWLTSHNSFVNLDDGWNHHPQQKLNIKAQFNHGVRSFMIDVHKDAECKLVLQHKTDFPFLNSRLFNIGGVNHSLTKIAYLSEFFTEIVNLLCVDRSAIITLHIESYVKSTEIKSLLEETGLSSYLISAEFGYKALIMLE